MKKIVILGCTAFISLGQLIAQDKEKTIISIGKNGLSIEEGSDKKSKFSNFHFMVFDLGFNFLHDQTDYSNAETKSFLNVGPSHQNENLFSLKAGKSINFNIYPFLFNAPLYNGEKQKISIYSGVGLQVYNFKFNKNLQFTNDPNPAISISPLHLTKNKLSVMYASIPFNFLMKTKLAPKTWLVYGLGIMGGVNISTWTKMKSVENGKEKNHDMFNLNPVNLNLTGEIGINGIVRFFGTYQLSNMYKNSLIQNPYSIGIRVDGI